MRYKAYLDGDEQDRCDNAEWHVETLEALLDQIREVLSNDDEPRPLTRIDALMRDAGY